MPIIRCISIYEIKTWLFAYKRRNEQPCNNIAPTYRKEFHYWGQRKINLPEEKAILIEWISGDGYTLVIINQKNEKNKKNEKNEKKNCGAVAVR
jgi:hypothetical protein